MDAPSRSNKDTIEGLPRLTPLEAKAILAVRYHVITTTITSGVYAQRVTAAVAG